MYEENRKEKYRIKLKKIKSLSHNKLDEKAFQVHQMQEAYQTQWGTQITKNKLKLLLKAQPNSWHFYSLPKKMGGPHSKSIIDKLTQTEAQKK